MRKLLFIFAVGIISSFWLSSNSIAAIPSPIQDLRCSAGGELGSIWLTWTVPTEGVTAYDVRYVQGNTLSWPTAIIHHQTWAPGTAGEVRQEIVRGLNPGTEFAFSMKARVGETLFSISNQALCTPSATSLAARDILSPSTIVSFPVVNTKITAGNPLTIRGSSKDRGLSSVQKVELSFDGRNWVEARPVSNIGGNLTWEYLWKNPSVNINKISVRSYDWLGNIESPVEIPVVVTARAAQVPPTQITPPKDALATLITPTPILLPHLNPVTTVQIRENIVALQNNLIILIQRLLTILTAELQTLR